MKRNEIPTARFSNFQDLESALQYLDIIDHEIVIKASGLAAGKGVVLPNSKQEAIDTITDMMCNKKFGESGQEIVIEERLIGEEVSILAFCDGQTAVCMPAAQVLSSHFIFQPCRIINVLLIMMKDLTQVVWVRTLQHEFSLLPHPKSRHNAGILFRSIAFHL
jgi:phosphoribosylaminoimidazole carboxylase (NCAIR synthetase)